MAWKVGETLHLLLLLLNIDCTAYPNLKSTQTDSYLNLELTQTDSPIGSIILTCIYRGTTNVTSVGWYLNSTNNVPLILNIGDLDKKCDLHSTKKPYFAGYKIINYTCDQVKNIYTLEIEPPIDEEARIICKILDPPLDGYKSVAIHRKEPTTSSPTFLGDHWPDGVLGIGVVIIILGFICSFVILIVKVWKRTDQKTGAEDDKSKTGDKRSINENSRHQTETPGKQYSGLLGLGIWFSLIVFACIIYIVVLAIKVCSLPLRLGLGITVGIIIIGCIVCIVILVKRDDNYTRHWCGLGGGHSTITADNENTTDSTSAATIV